MPCSSNSSPSLRSVPPGGWYCKFDEQGYITTNIASFVHKDSFANVVVMKTTIKLAEAFSTPVPAKIAAASAAIALTRTPISFNISVNSTNITRSRDNVVRSSSSALWRWLQTLIINLVCQAHNLLISTGGELGDRFGRLFSIKRLRRIACVLYQPIHTWHRTPYSFDFAFVFARLAVFD